MPAIPRISVSGAPSRRQASFCATSESFMDETPLYCRSLAQPRRSGEWRREACLSSIILSPRNGNVKMSPHETGDIHVESEGTAASERNQRMHEGRHGASQSRRIPMSERALD